MSFVIRHLSFVICHSFYVATFANCQYVLFSNYLSVQVKEIKLLIWYKQRQKLMGYEKITLEKC
ncbi:hypothetical protein [Coleofasciculus sp. F4-SAH-05]|uniref:hypothetical protein n=1 Tax=Coleofasciculus sp. F4-SAH-05 TaxID=3069525 RepID=UPI0032FAF6C5